MISIHDEPGAQRLLGARRVDPHHGRLLRNAFYKARLSPAEALACLPAGARQLAERELVFHALTLAEAQPSSLDGSTKLLFRTSAGEPVESVLLRIRSGRTALCVSSQVGCAARCVFCATGYLGLRANLSRDELLDQVVQAGRLLRPEGRQIRNLVFMGMGEPFHNEDAVFAALEVLLSPRSFAFAPRRVVISTVGVPEGLLRCARDFPGVLLALSLHSARQNVRETLVPLARKHDLATLRKALEEARDRGSPRVMIEYTLLDGLNDGVEDARALVEYLRDLPAHVNLIPFNPIAEAPGLRASPAERTASFRAVIEAAGLPVTLRRSLGPDITAACGQLAGRRIEAAPHQKPAPPFGP